MSITSIVLGYKLELCWSQEIGFGVMFLLLGGYSIYCTGNELLVQVTVMLMIFCSPFPKYWVSLEREEKNLLPTKDILIWLGLKLALNFELIMETKGQRDSAMGKALTLYTADLGVNPSIPYGPLATTGVISEYKVRHNS